MSKQDIQKAQTVKTPYLIALIIWFLIGFAIYSYLILSSNEEFAYFFYIVFFLGIVLIFLLVSKNSKNFITYTKEEKKVIRIMSIGLWIYAIYTLFGISPYAPKVLDSLDTYVNLALVLFLFIIGLKYPKRKK